MCVCVCVCVSVCVCVFECVCLSVCVWEVHRSGTHSATRWPAPNCSIHCACTAVWPKGKRIGDKRSPIHKNGKGKTLSVDIFVQYINEYK